MGGEGGHFRSLLVITRSFCRRAIRLTLMFTTTFRHFPFGIQSLTLKARRDFWACRQAALRCAPFQASHILKWTHFVIVIKSTISTFHIRHVLTHCDTLFIRNPKTFLVGSLLHGGILLHLILLMGWCAISSRLAYSEKVASRMNSVDLGSWRKFCNSTSHA